MKILLLQQDKDRKMYKFNDRSVMMKMINTSISCESVFSLVHLEVIGHRAITVHTVILFHRF